MKTIRVNEPSEIDNELRELSGSTETYNQVMDNLAAQMRQIAETRGKINLKPKAKITVHKSIGTLAKAVSGVAQPAGEGTVAKSKLKRRATERR